MKKFAMTYLKSVCLFLVSTWGLHSYANAAGTAYEYKYGKVPISELEQNTCPIDSTADAMYLYHGMNTTMATAGNDILLVVEHVARIKILTEEGKDQANISIAYHYNPKRTSTQSHLVGLSATVYNLEDGKIVATKMDKDYVTVEQTSDNQRTTKLALTNVKAGSVIEYKYSIKSPRIMYFPTWYAQRSIPVMHCHAEIMIPEYFKYRQNMVGSHKIYHQEKEVNHGLYDETITWVQHTYDSENLPGVKNENFIYSPYSYTSSISYEVNQVIIPGRVYKNYSSDWKAVRQQILKDDDYTRYLKMSNPFQAEMDTLLSASDNAVTKAQKLYKLLKQKVKWDETYTFKGENPKNAVKEGKGSNTQLNFLLMSMMQSANIPCTPLFIKFRNNGPLPLSHATIDDLNTFIVSFCDEEGQLYFLDGSADFGGVNVFPVNMLGEGILLNPYLVGGTDNIYRLSELVGGLQKYTYRIQIDSTGMMTGNRRAQYRGFADQEYKNTLHKSANDTTQFVQDIEKHYGIEISKYKYNTQTESEIIQFTTPCDVIGDEIYFNAMGLADEHTNHFTADKRQLPVMFPYQQSIQINTNILLPAGYAVQSLPKPLQIQACDGKLAATFLCENVNNFIRTTYQFQVNTAIVPTIQYDELKEFWKQLMDMNNQMVVLKKQ